MKKFVSIAVALAMVLSLSIVAFADTTVASTEITVSGSYTIDILDGADFTDETLYLYIYFSLNDDSKAGWGPAGLCSPTDGSVNCIGYQSPGGYELTANADGYVCFALTDIAAAFEAAGFDANDGVILNWWEAEYCTPLSVALVSTDDNYAVAEEETTEAAEESAEAAEETTESTEASSSEETASAASPSTGVALALVPMALAGIAVVSSKRR
ncbi:MAG: hypothetical protein LUG86_09985 [Oscillospiraceae bacterium]|nr:hypothetical protein [Oscillospiraceae bacterium]